MLTPRVISFDQIQEGDTLRVRKDYEQKGITFSRDAEGIASFQSEGGWFTEERGQLVPHTATVIYLMHRPKPPLPTTPGTIFRATEVRGEQCDTIIMVREPAEEYGPGYCSAHWVKGTCWHDPEDITAWEPIEGVTK